MNKIKLGANEGFIEIRLDNRIEWQNEGTVSIRSGNYYVNDAEIWVTLDEIITLFDELQEAYNTLKCNIEFCNLDRTLQYTLQSNLLGHMKCKGSFQEFPSQDNNRLMFEFIIDQSHLAATILDIKPIIEPYYLQKIKRK